MMGAPRPTRLLHGSDLHFGTERAEVCEGLRRLVEVLRPDGLVFSGDLTQRASAAQFARARAFLDTLGPAPRLLLPGNHDLPLWNLPARLFHPWKAWRDHFGWELEPAFDLGGFQLTSVLTARPWRQQGGVISARQRERVADRLARCPRGVWPVVVTHHPVWVPRSEERTDRPWGASAALDRWARVAQPVVLGGHTHEPFVHHWAPDGPAGTPSTAGAWIVQSGTAVSSRLRQGRTQSVTLLSTRTAGDASARPALDVVRYDWDGRAFEPADRQVLGGRATTRPIRPGPPEAAPLRAQSRPGPPRADEVSA